MKKRMLSLALALVMVLGLTPIAHAEDAYLWPSDSTSTSQGYGNGHNGQDITSTKGSNIYATKSGTVVAVYTGCANNNAASSSGKSCGSATGCDPSLNYYKMNGKTVCNYGYGNGLAIKHSDGSGYSTYSHMQSVSVTVGQTVSQGDVVGQMGSAGNSTGTHCHFELVSEGSMTEGGKYFRPTKWINNNKSAVTYITETPPLGVQFLPAAQSTWANKEKVTETNAVVVAQIKKNSGVKVTEMGLDLYDAKGTLIKSYSQKVTTPDTSTSWPCYWDINEEIGVTLTSGTTYQYRFTGVFNGTKYESEMWSFKTEGTPPSTSDTGSDSGTLGIQFLPAAQSTWANKEKVTETNAVVVAQTKKNSGVKVTEMGLDLYDANGKLIKSYSQKVTTPDTSTSWPCYWDINEEIGVTLTPGTIYQYRFTGVFNGKKYESDLWSFRTTGTAPEDSQPGSEQVTYQVLHYLEGLDGTYSSVPTNTDTYTGVIGEQVTPPVREYHGFDAPEQQTATIPSSVTLKVSYYYPRANFRLNVVAGDEGVAKVTGDGLYRYYENATVGVEVKPGYKFSHWIVDGGKLEWESFGYLIQEDNSTVTVYTEKVGPTFVKQPIHDLPYTDVPKGEWFYEPVQFMYDNGMMNGTSETTFSPHDYTTQGMMVTMLYRLDGEPEVSGVNVYGNEWYSKASVWGDDMGITAWLSAEVYYPPRGILREEMAIMLYKYAEAKGYDVSERADLSVYEDNKAWGDLYEEMDKAMAWCVAKGIITGTSVTTLSPRSGATRAQIAAILMRFCENVVNKK